MEDVSNGLQFAPQSTDRIMAYDSLYQRHFEYMSGGSESLKTSDSRSIQVTRFNEVFTSGASNDTLSNAFKGTVGLGPAFNVDLVASKKGCKSCNVLLTSKI